MSNPTMPDSLVNSLIRHKESGEIQRVIRDDGKNGLHISPPDAPSFMYPITVDIFDRDWELAQTVDEQLSESVPGVADKDQPFQYERTRTSGANLSAQVTLPTIDSRNEEDDNMADRQFGELNTDPFAGRAAPTANRGALNEETPADETTTGAPVGGNEEPAELLEEDRMDPDAADADAGPMPAEEEADESPAPKSRRKNS